MSAQHALSLPLERKMYNSYDGPNSDRDGSPPQVDGIGDYALQLARQLRKRHGLATYFIVGNPSWSGDSVDGFNSSALTMPYVQGSNRGFEDRPLCVPWGRLQDTSTPCCLRIPKAGMSVLARKCARRIGKVEPAKLNVAFHELDAFGAPPWSSEF